MVYFSVSNSMTKISLITGTMTVGHKLTA